MFSEINRICQGQDEIDGIPTTCCQHKNPLWFLVDSTTFQFFGLMPGNYSFYLVIEMNSSMKILISCDKVMSFNLLSNHAYMDMPLAYCCLLHSFYLQKCNKISVISH